MTSLIACEDPTRQWWQLGQLPPTRAQAALIGWTSVERAVDSDVPGNVALLIASAVTSMTSLSFPVGAAARQQLDMPAHRDAARISWLKATPLQAARALVGGRPTAISLCSTRTPQCATHLFTDPDFAWQLQGQIGILSLPSDENPELAYNALLSLLDGEWEMHVDQLISSGVVGLLRPGVDGDVVGLFSFTRQVHQDLMNALKQEAQRAGIGWELLSEPDFVQRLGS